MPLEMNVRFFLIDGTPLPDRTLYLQLVGSLIYLTVTCPGIAYAVHLVSQFMSAPHSTHYAAVLWILGYIKGTLFHGLHFSWILLLNHELILILTGEVILLMYVPLQVTASFLVIHLFLGVAKSKPQPPDLALKVSIVPLLTLLLRCFVFVGYLQI